MSQVTAGYDAAMVAADVEPLEDGRLRVGRLAPHFVLRDGRKVYLFGKRSDAAELGEMGFVPAPGGGYHYEKETVPDFVSWQRQLLPPSRGGPPAPSGLVTGSAR